MFYIVLKRYFVKQKNNFTFNLIKLVLVHLVDICMHVCIICLLNLLYYILIDFKYFIYLTHFTSLALFSMQHTLAFSKYFGFT